MMINKHEEHLLDIMDSMPDDACGDWRDSLAYAINTMRKYQKIEQIYERFQKDGDYYHHMAWLDVMEVLEDGNDN